MRLLILSDLHREHWREYAPVIDTVISRPDVVILAGDIHTGANAIDWAAKTFRGLPVLYVHGNHEGYGKNLEDAQRDIQEACGAAGNVHFLNCSEFHLGQVRFLGTTLWTDFKLFGDHARMAAMRAAEAIMVDYTRIRLVSKNYRKLRAVDTEKFHYEQKAWLQQKLDEPFDGKTIVITHMCPSMRSVPDRYITDPVSAAYSSKLDSLAARADLWVHGHTHTSFDYAIGKCRVVCNPCGYRMAGNIPENEHFNPNFVVEI